jgi:hypothetical protein
MAESRLAPVESLREGISPRLADAMRRGLASDPAHRTLTAAEMVDVLRAETNMDSAHVELCEKLSRVRPREARGSSAQHMRTPPSGIPAVTPAQVHAYQSQFPTAPTAPHARGDEPQASVVTPAAGAPTVKAMLAASSVPPPPATLPSISDDPTAAYPRSSLPLFPPPPSVGPDSALESRRSYDTPRAMAIPAALANLIAQERPAKAQSSRAYRWARLLAVAALVACGAASCGVYLYTLPLAFRGDDKSTVTPTDVRAQMAGPNAPPSGALAETPVAVREEALEPAPTTGDVLTPMSERGHRVFFDGQFAVPESGTTLRVSCGRHTIKIGSRGRVQVIDVPCGGSVTVEAR